MSLEDIIKAVGIDWTDTFISWSGGVDLDFEFDITPADFLRFANQDFQNKDERGITNAVTNAKRSIDCQVDRFLACLGYEPNTDLPQNVKDYIKHHSTLKEGVGIPQRLKLLRALEVAPSNLISRTRRIRHLLEHQYKLPTKTKASEAIEIATLFIGTLNNVLHTFIDGFDIGDEENIPQDDYSLRENVVRVLSNGSYFKIVGRVKRQIIGECKISNTENQYLELLRLNIAIGIGGNVEDALFDLLKTINCDIPKNMVKVTLV